MSSHSLFSFSAFKPQLRLQAPASLSRAIRQALGALRQIPREELHPAGIWVEDHARLLMDEAAALNRALKKAPALPEEDGAPRLMVFARRACAEGELSAARIMKQVRETYREDEITCRELALLSPALSCALFEQMKDILSGCVLEAEERKQALQCAAAFAAGRREALPREEGLLWRTLRCLSAREDQSALSRAYETLAARGVRAEEAEEKARRQWEKDGLAAGRIIGNFKKLQALPWGRIAEKLSPVAAVLREESTYERMDAASRDYYRQCACRIAKACRVSESAAARAAMILAEGKEGAAGQAGYYLCERPDLVCRALGKKRAAEISLKKRTALFLTPLYGGAPAALLFAALLGLPWYLWGPLVLCASEWIRRGWFFLLRRRFPARRLPRLRVQRLTEENRTLAVIPTLLTSRRQALSMMRHLAALKCANPDPQLEFMLLADFADSPEETKAEDEEILSVSRMALEELNRQWGGGFLYLHRARKWDMGQRQFTGRERKRGALEELNRLLTEGTSRDSFLYMSASAEELKDRYAFVITLDADTFLPPGAAQRMVGAMLHPLQKGRISVLQPRMAVSPDTVRSRVQKALGGRGGGDPYFTAVQDIYQDVFGRGSFSGKGIYEPRRFLEKTRGRLPEGRLLSHDLIEGETAGSALAEDIVLYDGHPASLSGWQQRFHRWTRGDWQLLPFLADKRLSLLSRHKIWDNLRRSLLPLARLILVFAAGAGRPGLLLLALPFPLRGLGWRAALLPGWAWTAMDAAFRALYRQFISKRFLLSWVTAEQGEKNGGASPVSMAFQLLSGAALSALSLAPGGFAPLAVLGLGWMASPLLIPWMNGHADRQRAMTESMEEECRRVAKATWRFFEENVGPDTLYLPPDNVQLEPEKGPALRTSPTNVGLYLLSCCAARELKLISFQELCRRTEKALDTLEGMETWKGHFYNWYELKTGAALPPRFVSTVDSGNLMGCLLCCAQLFRAHMLEGPQAAERLPRRLEALARRMDFRALYDPRKHLFSVGWETEQNRLSPARYDCLASEARLASFLGIMTGQIEPKHWKYLGRKTTRAGGGTALLSWGGTLFEYLMPTLLLPLTPGTLLGEGCIRAVRAQMGAAYGRPWGVSESGWAVLDTEMNYQYRAFGLPALALSGETGDQVTAPYASMLALPFFPRAAAENMRRMERMGWLDQWGFLEAADYTACRPGEKPKLVKSHMAHHQGMILCALCNALENQVLVRAFMKPPEAQAWAFLLWEKAPLSAPRREALPPPRPEKEEAAAPPRVARRGYPLDAHALSGGGSTWVLTARGQGFLSHGNMMITRFNPRAGEWTGPQFYLRDGRTGSVLSLNSQGEAVFEEAAVCFRAEFQGLRVLLRCAVDPLLGMAAAEVRLENPGLADRSMEAVSFLEIAQCAQAADQAHSNFQDLSVQVLPWGKGGLISRRLPREKEEKHPLIWHLAVGDFTALSRQGDRLAFLGRSGGYAHPEALELPPEERLLRTGDVVAPCLSLCAKILVPARQTARIFFLTLTGEEGTLPDEETLTPSRALSAFSLAAVHARMTARFIGLRSDELSVCRAVLGACVFYGQPHQQKGEAAAENTLWQIGVSGTLPVMLVRVLTTRDAALVRHGLNAHAWMRLQGIPVDLIFLCPPETAYHRPCRDQILRLAAAGPDRDWIGAPGGVHIAEGDDTRFHALESLARLTLRSGRGCGEQLEGLREPDEGAVRQPFCLPTPLEGEPLRMDNGFGGFTSEGGYRVTHTPPVPWHHMLCSPLFGTLACESGLLFSYAGNSRLGRITAAPDDVFRPCPSEEICLINEENTWFPLARCAAVYEPGTAEYMVRADGITCRLSVFTHGERCMGVRSVTLLSPEKRTIRLAYAVRFSLGDHPEWTRIREEGSWITARGTGDAMAWAAMENGLARPAAPEDPLSGFSALLLREGALQPREPLRVILALGCAKDPVTARQDWDALLKEGASQAERNVRAFWSGRLSALALFSGEEEMNWMMNRWLPYQVMTARLMARMGPYQPGGAFGFRDQLQDCLALLYTEPETVRAHLLVCAAHQFREGDVQHWWHAPRLGVRTRIQDDRLFLPWMTARYVLVTGDESILSEEAPYLESAPLQPQERDRYEEPAVSACTESLLAHCLRALDSIVLGRHGLPLMGGGDWNDGMNRVGGEKGESVWLGFFFAITLRDFGELCPPEKKEACRALRRRVLDGAENAWTGKWYLRAWYDDGRALGGPETTPPRIDLISQCFACLAGAPGDHARTALIYAVEKLYDREAGMVRLLAPPFAPEENAGYIGAYLPGVRENGGQYTHAVPWLIMALKKSGEYDLAWEIARALLPSRHSAGRAQAEKYKTEPYVLCGDVYALENRGRGGWSWYTGSAAWLYWVVLTELLGFEKRGNKARLRPCLGEGMEEFTIVYRFGSANYHFAAVRDTLFPTLDGVRLEDGWALLQADGRTHEARFPIPRA